MGKNACFTNGHASVETRVLKALACRKNVGGFFKILVRVRVGVS